MSRSRQRPFLVRAHLGAFSSFGVIGYYLVKAMVEIGLPVGLEALTIGPLGKELERYVLDEVLFDELTREEILISLTPNKRHGSAFREILFFPWESLDPPPKLEEKLDGVHSVMTPSIFSKQSLEKGTSLEIHLVPHGVDSSLFKPGDAPSSFTFLFVGEDIWRKNLDGLVLAFKKEFTGEPVSLLIKSNVDRFSEKQISVLTEKVPFAVMPEIYRSASCFVSQTRGEGFCLPALEAVSSGLPVIMPEAGAHTEFLNQSLFEVEIEGEIKDPGTGLRYLEPSLLSLREKMREVYEEYEAARKRALKEREKLVKEYTWERAALLIGALVSRLSGDLKPPRFNLKLGL